MRIFISYRREDSAGSAGRLHDGLAKHFGSDNVFRDVADIYAGDDFRKAIEHEIGMADVVLVVIGPRWLDVRDGRGGRRLDDPDDVLRLEVAAALARNVRVIPVLVDRGSVPADGDLPDGLRPLARRNAVEIRDTAWDDDVRRLVQAIKGARRPWRRRIADWLKGRDRQRLTRWSMAAAAAGATLVAAALYVGQRGRTPAPPAPSRLTVASVWVREPKLDGHNLASASRSVREKLESALLKIAAVSRRTSTIEIVDDEAVISALVYAGCPDREQAFRVPACAKQLAIDRLGIGAEVVPALRSTEKVGSITLALRIGKGVGIGRMTERQMQDGFYDALADWGAEQVALYLGLKKKQIDVALERRRKHIELLEGTLFGTGPASPPEPGATSWGTSFTRVALAQEPPGSEQEISDVLHRLRSALQTMRAGEVAPLYASMSAQQRDALQRYFDNLDSLRVEFSDTDITVQGDTARAAFVREDRFKDKDTGENSSLAVRLVAVMVRSNGQWKIQSLQKPS